MSTFIMVNEYHMMNECLTLASESYYTCLLVATLEMLEIYLMRGIGHFYFLASIPFAKVKYRGREGQLVMDLRFSSCMGAHPTAYSQD